MDNFRKPKARRGRGPIDGILRPNRPSNTGSLSFQPPSKPSSRQPKLDDFRRPDGFHASGRADILPPATADRPRRPVSSGSTPMPSPNLKHKREHRVRRYALRGALTLFLALVLTGGFLFGKAYWKARHIFKGGGSAVALQDNVDPSLLKGEGDGRVNILILGKGGPGHDGPDLTDTLLVASIDPINKDAALLSIPRDLYVKSGTGATKINAVYALAKQKALYGKKQNADTLKTAEAAGIDAIENSVEDVTGIPMHYYVMVDFTGFKDAIDTVGGITVNVPEALYDPSVAWENHNNPLIAAKGLQTMHGTQALLYARSRHSSARGDFDRSERQRLILLALKDKVLNAGTFANPVKLSSLLSNFGDHVQTNFSVSEMLRVYQIGKGIDSSKVQSLGLADPPNNFVTTSNIGGLSVVVPRAGLYNYTEIQNYVRNTLRDGFIKNENASIMVLNGTTIPGLATTKANSLKSFGYNVTAVGDAPSQGYSQTVIVNLRGSSKKYTQHYLESRFHVTATSSLPDKTINPGTADFVIILGSDAAP